MALPDEERLHKGLGVREPGVVRSLSEEFVDRLRIFPDDPTERGLAKIIWQLSGVILRVPVDKPKWVTVLRAMYNLDQDPEINPLVLKDRLEVLYQRHGRGWHPSTTNTKLSVLRSDFLRDELKSRVFPWPPKDEIDALERSEARYAAEHSGAALGTFVLPKDTLGLMIADLNGNGHRRSVERTLPQADLHFAVSADGNLVTTVTDEFGENLPAFTSAALLRQYLERVHAPENRPADGRNRARPRGRLSGARTGRPRGEPARRPRRARRSALDSGRVGEPVNAEHSGYLVVPAELEALAGTANSLSETIRTAWQRDWFEDDKWPDSDPLREAVITYRRSLKAAMDRLSTGADRMAGHLRATAERYQKVDERAAHALIRIVGDE